MSLDILSTFHKVWKDKHFYKLREMPSRTVSPELPETIFKQTLLPLAIITHDSVPAENYVRLGIKLTETMAKKLKNNGLCCSGKTLKMRKRDSKKIDRILEKTNFKRQCHQNCKIDSKAAFKSLLSENIFPSLLNDSSKTNSNHCELLKETTADAKLKNNKEPGRKTLKRKRWQLDKLRKSNESYQDDLFEDNKFHNIKPVLKDDNDNSEKIDEMKTPRVCCTPKTQSGSPTHSDDDDYSPRQLFMSRKDAEEYIYRRNKLREMKLKQEKNETCSKLPEEEYKNSAEYTTKTLEDTRKILSESLLKKPKEPSDSEEEQDDYFSDSSD